jgi:hypothetical protein
VGLHQSSGGWVGDAIVPVDASRVAIEPDASTDDECV